MFDMKWSRGNKTRWDSRKRGCT